ncbi:MULTISPECIES: ABC transporter substrate-binding protein [unclassified Paenibacillus]|uniref:ABC transporter substrate-binding protein n=1 Tax=unclassified Paenibacillus TaxID=185978 RepID=UPI001AE663C5|nr:MULTISPECIES: ABC transporter substrate-binding protein [unclassified Paenibacillus]MBP1157192.1 iron(III) transport system substrate-binding protein [Paenibacillus sp. PvP091]MBP1172069.1 iron(III) transport system substrate-binding protein [Paenibacillus sp. PvR098]MBP2438450.1 iron(III) transport system substrate-binding protein [Paenibacillus sp. PvP052]
MLGNVRGKRTPLWIAAVLGCIVLASAACSGQNASPQSDGNQKQAAPANTTPSGSANVNPEWENIVNEAKKEGKVIISGSPSDLWKKSLADAFEAEYPGIKVEYSRDNSRDFWARVRKEQEMGQYLWDLRVGGASGDVYSAKNQGLFDPIQPFINPEHTDDSIWFGGFDGAFIDKESKYMFSFLAFEEPTTFVNRELISEAELSSTKQLTDPKFKGKIAIQDPRGGAGQSSAAALMEMYGEDYITNLFKNMDIGVTADKRQQAEWLVRGKYPITIGFNVTELLPFLDQGLGKQVVALPDDVPPQGMGLGGIQIMKNSPHPNATKVYTNWLLSQKAQQQLVDSVKLNSRRLDVKPGDEKTVLNEQNKDKYFLHYREEYVDLKLRIFDLQNELIKK